MPRSDLARTIRTVYALIGWIVAGIGLVVISLLLWTVVRYRARPGAGLPRQRESHLLLEIAWTVVPVLILLVIAVPTIRAVFRTQGEALPGALPITVRASQWWWEFRYDALGFATANEPHVPAGRPVLLRLEGPDVIHSFWVPALGGKRDVVPGRVNHISFTADTPGEYPGQCAEYCGVSHANMRMRVIVEPPGPLNRWVAAQRAPPGEPSGLAAEGKEIFIRNACVGCHSIRGLSSGGLGPDLTCWGGRWVGGTSPKWGCLLDLDRTLVTLITGAEPETSQGGQPEGDGDETGWRRHPRDGCPELLPVRLLPHGR
ncbi:MAG TPA: cytochrome c oxidase subunit II [Candidatus Binatia bacterium]|nr:cytochrome c oxidase subunit II [Candidatus Binatia bacterium]